MSTSQNRRVLLAARPVGAPRETDFEIAIDPVPEAQAGQVLVKGRYLSLDPYMRGRMSAAKSYAPPVDLGEPMVGEVVGEVVASEDPTFAVGDIVAGMLGWQEWAAVPGSALRKISSSVKPISYALGVLGMPGLTAYFGLLEVGQPKPGDTVVVSAAAGAVG
ncbi:MAG: NADP-dependent oxidoreductase, partial [Alphaproteobacteria bacterium]|nr:NADP-dependent oxidoreductase [Alphaproteobacteria bacterium]